MKREGFVKIRKKKRFGNYFHVLKIKSATQERARTAIFVL